ncbi:MAG: flagellar biosynthetic protein FliO [Dehalococcoidia bacterium]|nr:flagellar biosynthetic protein FliO [Dehalococcoidia bacterium]
MTMRRRAVATSLAVGGLLAVLPVVALAQAPGEVGGGVVRLGAWDWINLVVRLVAVVAIIWGAFWALRWYNRRIQTGYGAGRSLEVLETRALGPNRSMQLVRVGRRAVLVGVTVERINQLLEIDDPEEVERLAQAAVAEQGRGPALNRVVESVSRFAIAARSGRSMSARAASPSPTSPTPPAPATQQVQANAAYRSARIAELQRAIEDARRGTSYEQAR